MTSESGTTRGAQGGGGIPLPPSTAPAIRVVMMPRDTNPQGSIFGGVLMSLIDQAAWIEALRQASRRYVTVAMDKVVFKEPVLVGDVLSIWARTVRIGRTSITVHVDVRAWRHETGQPDVPVTSAEVVMVAVGADGKPVAISGG
ncbi:MAG: acyl-CoA thioesterase [Planctomycetota bacterium]|nr:acyl-CoA thioesterase [Planctomycetota bacterium]